MTESSTLRIEKKSMALTKQLSQLLLQSLDLLARTGVVLAQLELWSQTLDRVAEDKLDFARERQLFRPASVASLHPVIPLKGKTHLL